MSKRRPHLTGRTDTLGRPIRTGAPSQPARTDAPTPPTRPTGEIPASEAQPGDLIFYKAGSTWKRNRVASATTTADGGIRIDFADGASLHAALDERISRHSYT